MASFCKISDTQITSDIIHDDAMLDSWPMYLTLYRMMLDLWSVYLTFTEWHHVGLVICVSDIIQDDAMLDSWSVYLIFYRMTPCWTRDLYLTLYRMTPCWTCDLCIWHLQNDAMLDSWYVSDIYRMMPCWTRDLCIWHYTEWRHVGVVICASDIIQNGSMLDSWSHHSV